MNETTRLIRYGKVSAVNAQTCAARVVFDDRDGLVSAELPVLQSSCLNNKFFNLPDVGDSVVCLLFPNDQHGSGVVLGSFYNEKNPAPAQNQDISLIQFGDGTELKYNRSEHLLEIKCVGKIKINGTRIDLNE